MAALQLVFLSFRVLVKVFCTAGIGFWLRWRGTIDKTATESMSKVCVYALVPALVFTRTLSAWKSDLYESSVVLPFYAFLIVTMGFLLGQVVARLSRCPRKFRPAFVGACTVGNSQSLPMVIVTTMMANYDKFNQGDQDVAIAFISLYLPVLNILMWLGLFNWLKSRLSAAQAEDSEDEEMLHSQNKQKKRKVYPIEIDMLVLPSPAARSPEELEDVGLNDWPREGEHHNDQHLGVSSGLRASVDRSTASGDHPNHTGSHGERDDEGEAAQPRVGILKRVLGWVQKVANPPIISIVVALVAAATIRDFLVPKDSIGAPVFSALQLVGDGAIPITFLVLGSNLYSGFQGRELPIRCFVSITAVRMLLMPIFGMGLTLFGIVVGLVPANPALRLVLLIESCVPTANNVVNMLNTLGAPAGDVATAVLWQYVASIGVYALMLPAFLFVAFHGTENAL